MRVKVLGGGFYGCHIALKLKMAGHEVQLHEKNAHIFTGASGNIPARLHLGFHYPRSYKTRESCRVHSELFMREYGQFTAGVPVNIYAVADKDSLVDYQQYVDTMFGEVPFIEIHDPWEFGIYNTEGAVLTGERHILTTKMAMFFNKTLAKEIHPLSKNTSFDSFNSNDFDYVIDCTFASNSNADVDRYEPCVVGMLEGRTDFALTVMDGPFASIYPWDPTRGLCSLSSAKYTPLSKSCKTYEEAQQVINNISRVDRFCRVNDMVTNLEHYYPAIKKDYFIVDARTSIRAMPRSGADTRLVDVRQDGKLITVRAGKIDAIFQATKLVFEMIGQD